MKVNSYLLKTIIGIVTLLLFVNTTNAQSVNDLRINEVLVENDSNYIDDFGVRGSWIEIFNSAYNYVNIGGMCLSNDKNDLKKYIIPKGDPATLISPRGYLVFWADNKTTHGTLHLNFTLDETNTLFLSNGSGTAIIDSLSFDRSKQRSDVSYVRITDGDVKWGYAEKCTPNATNVTIVKESPAEIFGRMDPFGIGMAIIAMSVVFVALAALYILFKYIGKANQHQVKRSTQKEEQKLIKEEQQIIVEASGEENAAIAMALFLFDSQLHDEENTILTINKTPRFYSPWSSKIYSLRKSPR